MAARGTGAEDWKRTLRDDAEDDAAGDAADDAADTRC